VRAPVAARTDLHTAIAFPILLRGQTLSVIEFFSHAVRQPDKEQLATLSALGNQIGQFIERKRVEEALREQERFIHQITELSPVVLDVFDLVAERHNYFSSDVINLFGYTQDELARMKDQFTVLVHPEDMPRLRENIERLKRLGDGEIQEFECRVRRRDGAWRWIASRSMVFARDEKGKVRQTVNAAFDVTERMRAEKALRCAHDELEQRVIERTSQLTAVNEALKKEITERKRAEEELRESNRRIEDILESITDEFNAFDREWRFTYLNEPALNSIRRAKGEELTSEEVLGKNVWEMFPAHVGSVFYQKYLDAMREQKTMEFEARSPVTDRWIEGCVYPSEEGLSVYYRDITERKRAEERLAYHAYLLENVHDAVIATNERLAVTAWNKGAEQMYGWRTDEALGRHIWEVVPVELSDEQRAEALRELEERGRFRTEAVTYRKDGTPVYVEGITIALRGEQEESQITGYVNIRRDITERKLAEEALKKAFAEIKTLKDQLAQEKLYLEEEIRSERGFEEIIGESVELKRILKQMETVAPTDSTVLIEGETGTGKELIARAIHNLSSRRERTFVKISCAAIPMGLLEAECSGTRRVPSPGPSHRGLDVLSWPTAVRSFSTKSGRSPWSSRQSCCGCCRSRSSSGWAVPGRSVSMCG
jgi:PAS domain S-box-containing protein